MKYLKQFFPILLLLVSTISLAQSNFTVEKMEMTIDGTSTLHDWTSVVTEVNIDGNIKYNNSLQGIENLKVSVPVTSIESSKGRIMDNKTYGALKSEEHPNITYMLEQVNSIDQTGNEFTVRTQGQLTIAGTKKTIYMTFQGKVLSNGKLQFEGSYTLNMTDYNVDPPSAMLGTINTGEEVTVKFDIILEVSDMSN